MVTGDGDAAAEPASRATAALAGRRCAPGGSVERALAGAGRPTRGAVVGRRAVRAVEWPRPRSSADDRRLARLAGALARRPRVAAPAADRPAPDDTFLAAGVPWYLTLFGRDSLWAARMLLPLGTDLAAGTLRVLARRQGTHVDRRTGEAARQDPARAAPARRVHRRRGADCPPPTTAPSTPPRCGSACCTTPGAGACPPPRSRALLPPWRRRWAGSATRATPTATASSSTSTHSGHGLANQGWKDSGDSVRFRDGRLGGAADRAGRGAGLRLRGRARRRRPAGRVRPAGRPTGGAPMRPRWPTGSAPRSGSTARPAPTRRWRWTATSSRSTR